MKRRLEGAEMWNTYEVARFANAIHEEMWDKLNYLFERMDSIEGMGADTTTDSERPLVGALLHACRALLLAKWEDAYGGLVDDVVEAAVAIDAASRRGGIEEVGADGWPEEEGPGQGMGSIGGRVSRVENRLRLAEEDIRVLMNDPSRDDIDDEGDPFLCPGCGAPWEIVRPGENQPTCRCDEAGMLEYENGELRRRLAEKPVGLLAENERLRGEARLADIEREDDIDDEGDPGECPECGAPYEIVRPGKVQDTCRCEEVHRLTEEVARVQREHEALLDYNERLLAECERLRAAAANWALAEAMPTETTLQHTCDASVWAVWLVGGNRQTFGTPAEALSWVKNNGEGRKDAIG